MAGLVAGVDLTMNKLLRNKSFLTLISLLMLIVVITSLLIGQKSSGKAMVVSVSTDGHYAISSNEDKTIILWNLNNHSYRVVGTNANIYSAYFIPHSHKYLYQDLNDVVHVKNVKGKELKHFHNFPTYGQVMTSDLKHYFAMDDDWNLYKGIGNKQKTLKTGYLSFWGEGKLDNLVLSDNEQYLLTVGAGGSSYGKRALDEPKGHFNLDGPVLWQVKTGQPIKKFPGLQVKSFATIAPNNQTIIGVDESENILLWPNKNKSQHRQLANYDGYLYNEKTKSGHKYTDKIPSIPSDFHGFFVKQPSVGVISTKFITKNVFFMIHFGVPYLILYKGQKVFPFKFLSLGRKPYPSVADYERNASINTSWRAHILVTGQQKQGGIIVYKYNPNKQTLKKVWAPQPKKWQVWWREWL